MRRGPGPEHSACHPPAGPSSFYNPPVHDHTPHSPAGFRRQLHLAAARRPTGAGGRPGRCPTRAGRPGPPAEPAPGSHFADPPHADHTGGVAMLQAQTGARVLGPAGEKLPEPVTRLNAGDSVEAAGFRFQVIGVPGHTAGHIAYYLEHPGADQTAPLLFCGDTLFSGGCGRLFEGTPAQMLASLDRLSALPGNTRVCCAHEYTLSNLRFALAVEPHNQALIDYQAQCIERRAQHEPTLPSTIAREQAVNPFLRSRLPSVIEAVQAQAPDTSGADDAAVFAQLREWKNDFK